MQQNKNYPGSVASYNTRPGNEVGLFYNAPEPTQGQDQSASQSVSQSSQLANWPTDQ